MKYFSIIFICIFLCGCTEYCYELTAKQEIANLEMPEYELPLWYIQTVTKDNKIMIYEPINEKDKLLYQIYLWVNGHIINKKDDQNYWQTPEETLELRTGDCEDRIILILYTYYKITGDSESFVYHSLKTNNRYHAVIYYKDKDIYYSLSGNEVKYNDKYILRIEYTLEEAVKIAHYLKED